MVKTWLVDITDIKEELYAGCTSKYMEIKDILFNGLVLWAENKDGAESTLTDIVPYDIDVEYLTGVHLMEYLEHCDLLHETIHVAAKYLDLILQPHLQFMVNASNYDFVDVNLTNNLLHITLNTK